MKPPDGSEWGRLHCNTKRIKDHVNSFVPLFKLMRTFCFSYSLLIALELNPVLVLTFFSNTEKLKDGTEMILAK